MTFESGVSGASGLSGLSGRWRLEVIKALFDVKKTRRGMRGAGCGMGAGISMKARHYIWMTYMMTVIVDGF